MKPAIALAAAIALIVFSGFLPRSTTTETIEVLAATLSANKALTVSVPPIPYARELVLHVSCSGGGGLSVGNLTLPCTATSIGLEPPSDRALVLTVSLSGGEASIRLEALVEKPVPGPARLAAYVAAVALALTAALLTARRR